MSGILFKVMRGKNSQTIQMGVSLAPKPNPPTEKDLFLKNNSFLKMCQ